MSSHPSKRICPESVRSFIAMQHMLLVCESHLPAFHTSVRPKHSSRVKTLFPALLSPLFAAELSVLDCTSCVLHNRQL